MNPDLFSSPLPLARISITDPFWKHEMELVRTEVIPYQWNALNDNIEGAQPSYSIKNFEAAVRINRTGGRTDSKEEFHGFVFQDSDLYKWIEAVGYSLTTHPDAELERLADEAIDLICSAQTEDGYLDTYYIINGTEKAFTNLRDNHELYCFGHLTEAAVSYYQAAGKDKLLIAAERFADCIINRFGHEEGKINGYPGHEVAEMALARLYEVTGEDKYLDLAEYFIDERGKRPYYFDKEHPEDIKPGKEDGLRYQYQQAHLPVREQTEAVGHAVRAVYLYSGMADIARLTGDDSLYEACERLWHSVTCEKMYITGGIGALSTGEAFSYPFDLPNDTAYSETCASIGLIFFARRMLQIKPDTRYGAVMEKALFNVVLSGMALDGKSFFYVNPLEADPEACRNDPLKAHVLAVREPWFGCACCPPNLARLISSLGAYAFTEDKCTLFIHLYIGCHLTKMIGERTSEISIDSEVPWDGNITITVRAEGMPLKIAVRIPDWSSGYSISGIEMSDIKEEKDGYIYVEKEWGKEDTFKIDFTMKVRLVAADARVRQDIGKAAVMRGPLVYCMEEADNGKDLRLLALNDRSLSEAKVYDDEICGIPFKAISLPGLRKTGEINGLYHEIDLKIENKDQEVLLKFIPYYMWANRGENEMQVWTRLA